MRFVLLQIYVKPYIHGIVYKGTNIIADWPFIDLDLGSGLHISLLRSPSSTLAEFVVFSVQLVLTCNASVKVVKLLHKWLPVLNLEFWPAWQLFNLLFQRRII